MTARESAGSTDSFSSGVGQTSSKVSEEMSCLVEGRSSSVMAEAACDITAWLQISATRGSDDGSLARASSRYTVKGVVTGPEGLPLPARRFHFPGAVDPETSIGYDS